MTLSSGSASFLKSLGRFGIRPGLDAVRSALSHVGDPHLASPSFQIVGTNGKGSTASFLESALRASGYRTGRYTSPHLFDVRERIVLSGEPISPSLFEDLLRRLREVLDTHSLGLSYFEFLTVLAFMAFREAGCEVMVLEAGMGGRWDATSVCDPLVTVLTQVALDHEEILGPGIRSIFEEKVAVGRPGRPFVACLSGTDLEELFVERGRERGFLPVLFGRGFSAEWLDPDSPGRPFRIASYRGRWGERVVASGLTASYQIGNLAAAFAALEFSPLPLSPGQVALGIRTAVNPGRFEGVSESPPILLDGAHNVAAVKALAEALDERYGASTVIGFYLGIHQDKNWQEMLSFLVPVGSAFFLPFDPERTGTREAGWVDADLMAGKIRGMDRSSPEAGHAGPVRTGFSEELWKGAIDWASEGVNRVLVVTGSLYLVGAMRAHLRPSRSSAAFRPNERNLSGPDLP